MATNEYTYGLWTVVHARHFFIKDYHFLQKNIQIDNPVTAIK